MDVIPCKSGNPMSRGNMDGSGTGTLGWHTPRQDQGTPEVPSCTEHPRQREEGAAVGISEGVSHQNTSSSAAAAPACSCVSR